MSRELHNHQFIECFEKKNTIIGNDVEIQGSICRKNKKQKHTNKKSEKQLQNQYEVRNP